MDKQTKIDISNFIKEELIKIAKKHSLDLFILFGSRAKGTSKKNSDYDFAFIRKNKLSLKEKDNLENDIFKIIKYKDFDLIEISIKIPIILKLEIFRTGIALYYSNKKYYEYEKDNAYFDYVDSITLLEPTKEKFLSSSL